MHATESADLDRAVGDVDARKHQWLRVSVPERIHLLRGCLRGCATMADGIATAGCQAKGLDPESAAGAEEWFSGPIPIIRNLRLLIEALSETQRDGHPFVRMAAPSPDGDAVAQVFPRDRFDRLLYPGVRIDVWLRTAAPKFVPRASDGRVVLVLAAGNVTSSGPMDLLYKLFVEDRVVVLKMHPINDYGGPFFERAFAPLIDGGFLRIVYGDAAAGGHLVQHPSIDQIHITGSAAVHDRIAAATAKPITSELGCVTPVLVVPGEWSDRELAYQAEHVATMVAHNASCNCNAAKLVVTWKEWPQRRAFLERVAGLLSSLPPRVAYYPGSAEKYARFLGGRGAHEGRPQLVAPCLPFATIFDVDPDDRDNVVFNEEAWSPIVAETALPGGDAGAFLEHAVRFCNERVAGTLSTIVLVDPRARRQLGDAVARAVAGLRYGTVAINHWSAVSYALAVAPWGAYPGHTRESVGSGIGVVHNTQMLDDVVKTVLDAPFTTSPKPPWFVTHRRAHVVARRMVRFETSPSWAALPFIAWAALDLK